MSSRNGVLRYGLVLRNPDSLLAVGLPAGTEVPDWAQDLVHDDDLVDVGASSEAGTGKKSKGKKKSKDKATSGDATGGVEGRTAANGGNPAVTPDDPHPASSYDGTNKVLEAEIAKRNAGRDENAQIVPESGRKADLVAALEADDAAAAAS